ncbi:MAG: hypothetical protein ACM3O9_06120 [Methylocystaceae bacterium]
MLLLGILGALGLIIFSVWLLVVAKDENKRKVPIMGATICLLFALAGLSLGIKPDEPVSTTSAPQSEHQYRVGNITVNYEIKPTKNESNQTQVLVTTKNVGQSPFSGTVDVKSSTANGVYLDMDILHIFNLAPGQSRVSVCWLKLSQPPLITITPNTK